MSWSHIPVRLASAEIKFTRLVCNTSHAYHALFIQHDGKHNATLPLLPGHDVNLSVVVPVPCIQLVVQSRPTRPWYWLLSSIHTSERRSQSDIVSNGL